MNGYELLEKTFLPGNQSYISTFGEYAGLAFQTFLMVVIVLAIGTLTLSGLQYIISPAAGGKEEATKRIWAAITGLLLALSAYLILNTINPNLVGASLDLGNIGNITPPSTPPGNPPGGGTNPGGGSTGGGTPPTGIAREYPSGVGVSEDDARNQLKSNGITINNNERTCGGLTFDQYKSQYGVSCTSLDGIPQNALDNIINLKKSCPNCGIQVTGATEAGHGGPPWTGPNEHAPGSTLMDVGRDPTLDNYIRANGTRTTDTHNGPQYILNGWVYEMEDNVHWHTYQK